MTATADTSVTTPVDDEDEVTTSSDSEQTKKAGPATKRPAKPHTNVPAPLAGPARRTALALGVPSVGLAELLVHANFGWTGVAALTAAAAVGAGAVYAVRRQKRGGKAASANSKVGASKTPSSLAARLRAKPIGHSTGSASGRGQAAGRGGLASRVMSRFGGRSGGTGGGFGRGGGGLGGRSRGVAGRSGTRSELGSTGRASAHSGRRGERTSRALSSPGARAAAAKSAQLTGGRPSKTSAGLRKLSGGSPHRKAGRPGSGVGLGGGSFFGGSPRNSTPSRGRHSGGRNGHGGRGARPYSTSGGGRHGGHGGGHGGSRSGRSRSRGFRIPLRRPRMRTVATAAGAMALGALAVPVVMAGVALASVYGGFRLASSPRVRYGAAVIAGWVRLGVSRAYQWARSQWWKSRGKTTAAAVYVAEGETVDEPHASAPPRTASVVDDAEILDAEVVPDPAPGKPRFSLGWPGARQPTRPRPPKPATARPYLCQWVDDVAGRQCKELREEGDLYCANHRRVAPRDKNRCTWALDPSSPLSRLCESRIPPGNKYCEYHQQLYDAIPLIPPPPDPPIDPPVTPRQPKLAHTTPAPAGTASPQHQEISIVSALNDINATIAAAPAFTPTSGHDAEQYLDSIVAVLGTLGTRVSSDLQTIGEHLPQEAAALGTLNSLGEVLGAFATQAGEQVEAWKQTANWVWNQG